MSLYLTEVQQHI